MYVYMQTQPARICMLCLLKQHFIHPELMLNLDGHLDIFLRAESFFLPSSFLCFLSLVFTFACSGKINKYIHTCIHNGWDY